MAQMTPALPTDLTPIDPAAVPPGWSYLSMQHVWPPMPFYSEHNILYTWMVL